MEIIIKHQNAPTPLANFSKITIHFQILLVIYDIYWLCFLLSSCFMQNKYLLWSGYFQDLPILGPLYCSANLWAGNLFANFTCDGRLCPVGLAANFLHIFGQPQNCFLHPRLSAKCPANSFCKFIVTKMRI